jgi:hypothetical protein
MACSSALACTQSAGDASSRSILTKLNSTISIKWTIAVHPLLRVEWQAEPPQVVRDALALQETVGCDLLPLESEEQEEKLEETKE